MFRSATRIRVSSSKARVAGVVIRVIATGLRTTARAATRVSGVVLRAAAKVVIKGARATVRKTKAVSVAKSLRARGLSLPARWAIDSKLEQTRETRLATRSSANASKGTPPRSSSEAVYGMLSSMLHYERKGESIFRPGIMPSKR